MDFHQSVGFRRVCQGGNGSTRGRSRQGGGTLATAPRAAKSSETVAFLFNYLCKCVRLEQSVEFLPSLSEESLTRNIETMSCQKMLLKRPLSS